MGGRLSTIFLKNIAQFWEIFEQNLCANCLLTNLRGSGIIEVRAEPERPRRDEKRGFFNPLLPFHFQ